MDSELRKGLIVSIQGYSFGTTQELVKDALNAGAVAIKSDKPLNISVPLIGCHKIAVENPDTQPYLTNTLDRVQKVTKWSQMVSIDYRKCNAVNLHEISAWCKENKVLVVADIGDKADYQFIKDHELYYTWIATTFSVFRVRNFPDVRFAKQLHKLGEPVIAEGNYVARAQILETIRAGIRNVCIGGAISNVYKLTRRYVSVYSQDVRG